MHDGSYDHSTFCRVNCEILKRLLLLVLATLTVAGSAHAQPEDVLPIRVIDSADDMTGRTLVYRIKEEIRRSAGMRIAQGDENGIVMIISTLPKDRDHPNVATIYQVVWLLRVPDAILSYYLDDTFGYCGSDVVDSSARNLVASTDGVISRLRDFLNSLPSTEAEQSEN